MLGNWETKRKSRNAPNVYQLWGIFASADKNSEQLGVRASLKLTEVSMNCFCLHQPCAY